LSHSIPLGAIYGNEARRGAVLRIVVAGAPSALLKKTERGVGIGASVGDVF